MFITPSLVEVPPFAIWSTPETPILVASAVPSKSWNDEDWRFTPSFLGVASLLALTALPLGGKLFACASVAFAIAFLASLSALFAVSWAVATFLFVIDNSDCSAFVEIATPCLSTVACKLSKSVWLAFAEMAAEWSLTVCRKLSKSVWLALGE